MPMTPEQEWLLVGCGLIAHADEVLHLGEWESALRLIDYAISEPERERWRAIFADIDELEDHFVRLPPLAADRRHAILHRCWKMALVDGGASDIEETVHDRLARRLGITDQQVAAWREAWTQEAYDYAEMVAGLAAAFVNLDGELGIQEAIRFEQLLERLPLPIGRRLELPHLLHRPPALDPLTERLAALNLDDRLAALAVLVPLLGASERGGRERDAYYEIAARLRIEREAADRLITQILGA